MVIRYCRECGNIVDNFCKPSDEKDCKNKDSGTVDALPNDAIIKLQIGGSDDNTIWKTNDQQQEIEQTLSQRIRVLGQSFEWHKSRCQEVSTIQRWQKF